MIANFESPSEQVIKISNQYPNLFLFLCNRFMEMPHRQALNRVPGVALLNGNRKQKTTISQYFSNTSCPACGQPCDRGICADCIKNQSQTLVVLHEKCRQYERIYSNIKMVCN